MIIANTVLGACVLPFHCMRDLSKSSEFPTAGISQFWSVVFASTVYANFALSNMLPSNDISVGVGMHSPGIKRVNAVV